MRTSSPSLLPPPSADLRKAAAGQFERANQVVATRNYDYGIRLLLSCCKLDPANLIYRQALRRTEKAKYNNNLRGHWLAWLTTWPGKARVRSALRSADYVKVLDIGEGVLARNPWEVSTQMALSEAADHLGLTDLAIWYLEQARQKAPRHQNLNRTLARLYEKRGNFTQAMALWDLLQKEKPSDGEAIRRLRDLAASETIARGQYSEAVGREDGNTADGPVFRPKVNNPQPVAEQSAKEELTPQQARFRRDSAPIRARLKENPTSASIYLQLARLCRETGDPEQATKTLNEGLAATGNAFELTAELLDLEIEPFRKNLALADEKLRAAPDDPELRKLRARLAREINNRELELWRQKADRFPNDMNARVEMGIRLLRNGQHDEAIRELQVARADTRVRWQALLQLGHCFKARNHWKLAQRNYDEALQCLPPGETNTRKELLYLLAQGLAENGELARAVELGQELANDDFGYRDISQLLDTWQTRLDKEKISG
jgi:tetratricopeptide (TPR) repeat protein